MRLLKVLLGLVVLTGWWMASAAWAQGAASTQTRTEQRATEIKPAYSLPPEKLGKAIDFSRKRVVLGFAETGWGILQLILLLTLGLAAWMRDVVARLSRNRWVQGFAFAFLLLAITTVLGMPLDMYGHHLSLQYGMSVQHWGSWFWDQLKAFGLTFLVGGLLVMLLFWAIRKSPQRWWFWFWIPAMVAVVFGVFVYPIWVDPLFNKFEPLEKSNAGLVDQLEKVVARAGIEIPSERMFLMKASEKVTVPNAYVTGIGASKRVVVWDTTIASTTSEDIQFIFAHEMGHYVLNHIYEGLLFTAVVMLVFFWMGYHGLQWLLQRYGGQWRIPEQQDWASLVVLLLVISIFSFLAEPIENGFSRSIEHDADVYGQEAIHGLVSDPQAVARQSFQVLGEATLDDPNPSKFVEFWTFNHPSTANRAAFAASYNPWAEGETPKYFKK
jgi:Zn-dependent protease with chaperone function